MNWFAMTLILAVLGYNVFVRLKKWKKDYDAPVRSSMANVVGRRTQKHFKRHSIDITRHIAFQLESGQRLEFSVAQEEYERLGEGDHGRLRYKGTQYIDFKKDMD